MRLEKAIGIAGDSAQRMPAAIDEDEAFPTPPTSSPAPAAPKAAAPWDEDDDEDLSFFKKLAAD
jgi:hypothetical protein